MRKVLIVITMAVSYFVVTGAMNADEPPSCGPNCPWVQ